MNRSNKPISEFLYRLIGVVLILPPILYSFLAAIYRWQPYAYISDMIGYDDDRELLAWSLSLLILILVPLVIMLVLRAFADIPPHPFTKLPLRQLIFGEDDGYVIKEDVHEYKGDHILAPIEERLVAGLLDYLFACFFILVGLIILKVRAILPDLGHRDRHLISMIFYCIGIGYILLKDVINGQSIAKRLFHIRVVDEASISEESPLLRMVTRQLPSILCSPLIFVDIIMVLTRVNRQKLGDIFSHTIVIKYEKKDYL